MADLPSPTVQLTHHVMSHDCNPVEQTARQDRLEELYTADGRHDPAHPMHGTYTGLAEAERQQQRDELISAAFSAWWQDSYGRPPGTHAVMTHTAFAKHVLETLK
jgi:hypothetical protein